MSAEDKEADFGTISKQNFDKVTKKIANIGYQEGIYDGQQSQYQRDFDIGFATGFHSGFMRGKDDGRSAYVKKSKNNTISERGAKQNATKLDCALCIEKNLKDKPVPYIVEQQKKYDEPFTH